ncbi:MAG: hypothetical protein H8E25_11880 [Planctomycetes bacterium]|nr:hypothetical protein [Planctomycetota bacterium]
MSTARNFAFGCLAVVLLIFAAGFFGWKWIASNLGPTMNPEQITVMQHSVIDMDIPSDFTPTYAMYTDENQQDAMMIYIQEDKRSILSQLIIHQQSSEFTKVEAENRMGNSFPGLEITRLEIHEKEPTSFPVEVSFQSLPLLVSFEEGQTTEDAELSNVYSVIFPYRDYYVSIMLAGDPKFLNRAQFERLLKSIK